MDAFGDNSFGDVDPAADFLAREQSELAGLEDDLNPVTSAPILNDGFSSQPSGSPPNGSFDLGATNGDLASDSDAVNDAVGGSDSFGIGEDNAYLSSEPVEDVEGDINRDYGFLDETNETGTDFFGGEVLGLSSQSFSGPDDGADYETNQLESAAIPSAESAPAKPAPTPIRVPREEPEKIRIWREEQKTRLEEKDENEEKKKEEWREAAKKELEDWYRHHEDLIAKTKATNRNAEKEFVAEVNDIEPGTEWERIAKLCDFNPKASKASKDVSRMRSIILQLKQNPLPQKSS